MKNYPTFTASLLGVLSDDYLYFEGTMRPEEYFVVRDGGTCTPELILGLERYFNDLYTLFLRKLTQFAGGDMLSDEETLKLQALLQELIKVKNLIENAGKPAIMGE